MMYPPNLVPIKGWKKKINIEDTPNFPIVRRVLRNFDEDSNFFIDLGQGVYHIKLDADLDSLGLKSFVDLSMNIISEDSSLESSYYYHDILKIGDNKIGVWNGEEVNLDKYGDVYHYTPTCYFLIFESKNLHNIQFPFHRKYNNAEEWDSEKDDIDSLIDSVFNKNTTYSVIGKTILRHAPTPLNYWHIVIDVHAPNSKPPLRNAKSKWRQDVQTNIFENVIRKNISINSIKSKCLPMPKSNYIMSKYLFHIYIQKIIRWCKIISFKPARNIKIGVHN